MTRNRSDQFDAPIRPASQKEAERADGSDLPLTLGLLLVTALTNLYLYSVAAPGAERIGNMTPPIALVLPLAYLLLLLIAALIASGWHPWIVWLATSASNAVYAGLHSATPGLISVAVMYAAVGAITVETVRRLRVARTAYSRHVEALDAMNLDVHKRLEEQSALFDVSQRMALTFDIERLFHEAMTHISRRLRMYRGTLSLFDPRTQQLKVKYAYGLSEREIASGRYGFGEEVSSTVMETGEPMAVPNVGEQPIFLRPSGKDSDALDLETRSVAFLCVPIKMEGRTVGVLSVDRGPVDQRTLGDDLNFLTILASTFAQALKIQEMIDALVQHERLAVLGKMAQSVAHEVRNPLGGIRGAAQLLQMSLAPMTPTETLSPQVREEAEGYAGIIIQEVDRLNRVVEQLLHFGSAQTADRRKVRLRDVLEHVSFLVAADAEVNDVQIVRDVEEGLPPIEGDGDQITQVFLNLVRNALEAMPDGGELRLVARASGHAPHGTSDRDAARYVEVQVCDTGAGVPAHLREEIFSPLYTTKQKGTGIGLALTKRLVEEHGGYIEIGENPPHGTRFSVVLPALEEPEIAS